MDRDQELSRADLFYIAMNARRGTIAATITGGGEPTLHPYINEFIKTLDSSHVGVGLVTNGIPAKKLSTTALSQITWCRVSFSDCRKFDDQFVASMDYLRSESRLDLAFSYVLTDDPDYHKLCEVIEYANENNFTHVRIVSDILHDTADMDEAKSILHDIDTDTSRVIFQDRNESTHGHKRCLLSLLKPIIAADGYVYPCCGVQYARGEGERMFPEDMRMGHFTELDSITANQSYFDGSACNKCYYGQYNDALDLMTQEVDHAEFL